MKEQPIFFRKWAYQEEKFEGIVKLWREEWSFFLEFKSDFLGEKVFKGNHYFDCQKKLRLFLEENEYLLLVEGARKNVYPSGMSVSMSDGLRAYRLSLGKPALTQDLISIFAYSESPDISSVEDQENFFLRWKRSLNHNLK